MRRESRDRRPRIQRKGSRRTSRVEEGRGATEAVRFPSRLIKPDVRISRIRLSDWLHGRLTSGRLVACNGAVSVSQALRRRRPS